MRGNSVGTVLWMIFSTVLILLLAWAASRWVGLHGAPSFGAGRSEGFRVLRQLSLGRNASLALVKVREKCYLLGVTEHEVTLLQEIAGGTDWLEGGETPPPPFMEVFGETLRKRK